MSFHLLTRTLIEVVYRLKESVCFLRPANIYCSHWKILWHKNKVVLLTEDISMWFHRNVSGRKSWKSYNRLTNFAKHFKQKLNSKSHLSEHKAIILWNTISTYQILLSMLAPCKLICFGRKYKFFTFYKNKTLGVQIILPVQMHTRAEVECF